MVGEAIDYGQLCSADGKRVLMLEHSLPFISYPEAAVTSRQLCLPDTVVYSLKLNIICNRTFMIAHFLIENIHPIHVRSPCHVLGKSKTH